MGHRSSIAAAALLTACNVPAATFTPLVNDAPSTPDGAPMADGPPMDSPVDAPPGTAGAPAASCRQLRELLGPMSGVYWLRGADPQPPFQAYCEQELEGGGWAVVYNSVLRLDGTTLAFWSIPYANRFDTKGAPSITDNYYAGSLYQRGTAFLDTITDLAGTTAIALRADSQGINPQTMAFLSPTFVSGNSNVYAAQFATGWAAPDFDADTYSENCATYYSNVTQHYSACWTYNLGSDADTPFLDGGVGPHVHISTLASLGLTPQAGGGSYSRVQRITRYVRW